MSNFLIAKYNLHIKKLYDDVKEKIPGKLNGSFLQNRVAILAFVLPLVRKAYQEGIEYAKVYVNSHMGLTVTISQNINAKIKEKLLKEFLVRLRGSERIYKMKMEQIEELNSLHEAKVKKGAQEEQVKKEYINGIKRAVNNLIIRAGDLGVQQVWEKL